MNVLRHHYVADQAKDVLRADFIENTYKAITVICGSQQGTPADATERDEVKVALTISAFERLRINPHPSHKS
jgi:hypothetical protein